MDILVPVSYVYTAFNIGKKTLHPNLLLDHLVKCYGTGRSFPVPESRLSMVGYLETQNMADS